MKYLSKEQLINLHSIAIKRTGGIDGLRDNRLLIVVVDDIFVFKTNDSR